MTLPNSWELSFKRKYGDKRLVKDVYADFEQCWLYEVQVFPMARSKLKKWLGDSGWMEKTCIELLWEHKSLAWYHLIVNLKGLGGNGGGKKVYTALMMFLTYALMTAPPVRKEDYDAFYAGFANHGKVNS